jgi:hypothetical protein
MLYKTICLQMIQDRPQLYEQLLHKRILLATLERYALQLRTRHLMWKGLLSQAQPDISESQIASEALELALQELESDLPSASPQDETETLSLDAAMAFIRPMPSA